ncbi:hypothetical protein [Paenirhodobacter sp.]|uniref:hypothetical protein n=1 Tax=Paenirhodobacter sp. TaxID=1965326 RepID=UPI003B403E8C
MRSVLVLSLLALGALAGCNDPYGGGGITQSQAGRAALGAGAGAIIADATDQNIVAGAALGALAGGASCNAGVGGGCRR